MLALSVTEIVDMLQVCLLLATDGRGQTLEEKGLLSDGNKKCLPYGVG